MPGLPWSLKRVECYLSLDVYQNYAMAASAALADYLSGPGIDGVLCTRKVLPEHKNSGLSSS